MEKGLNFSIFSKGPIIPVKIIENPNIVMVKFPKKMSMLILGMDHLKTTCS